jgi:hypothetical protein
VLYYLSDQYFSMILLLKIAVALAFGLLILALL